MIKKIISLTVLITLLTSCVKGNLSTFGKGVSVGFDPRTVGMQIDDTIMQKGLLARISKLKPSPENLADKDKKVKKTGFRKYFLTIQIEVLDGRIFLTGRVDKPEEKILMTKLAWETRGVRSVENAITIRGNSNFKNDAKDILITAQLRSAFILSKIVKSSNYTLETINKNIYIFGIALNEEEKKEVIKEANKIYDVQKVIPSIYLVSELSRNKN